MRTASTVNLAGVTTASIGFWLYWNAFANDDDMAFESSANFNSNAGGILCDLNESGTGDCVFAVRNSAASGGAYFECPRPSASAWHHYLITVNLSAYASAPLAIYIDGVAQTNIWSYGGPAGSAPSGLGNYTWYLMSRAGSSLWGAGRMADFAIWTGAILNAAHAAALARGNSPRSVQPQSLRYHWDLGPDNRNAAADLSGLQVSLVPVGSPSVTWDSPAVPTNWSPRDRGIALEMLGTTASGPAKPVLFHSHYLNQGWR